MKRLATFAGLSAVIASTSWAQISLTNGNLSYSQSFDSLQSANSASNWTNNSTLPGWYAGYYIAAGTVSQINVDTTPTTRQVQINGGTGSSTAAMFYSFGVEGTNSVADRAFGSLLNDTITRSSTSGGTAVGTAGTGSLRFGVRLVNDTDSVLTSFTFSYDGEQWRNGANAAVNTLVTAYGIVDAGAGLLNKAGQYTNLPSTAHFSGPVTGGTAGALDGNASANRLSSITATVTGLTWAPGQELWIRWYDDNDPGAESGLAIDNFSFTASAVPEPSSFAALAGLGALGFVSLRRRRA